MRRASLFVALSFGAGLICPPADALCFYDGKLYTKTTVLQEFKDSKWVVRARVLSAFDCFGRPVDRCSDPDAPYTTYGIRVIQAYKGHPPKLLKFFTSRDSGGFYLDRAGELPAAHDIGRDYLLFLNPIQPFHGQPRASRHAVFVNYNCGQSKPWSEVPARSRRLLAAVQQP
jgi:hypothetical protein